MPRRVLFLCLLGCLLAAPFSWAAEQKFVTAKLLQVDHKTREKVTMYLVNTPVSTEVPYFEIVVRMGQTNYNAEFVPRRADEELPPEWVAGSDVQVRLEKHDIFLKRADGTELRWTVTRKNVVKDSSE